MKHLIDLLDDIINRQTLDVMALKFKRDWDESEHPRDPEGKFTFSTGGDDEGGDQGPAAFISPSVKPISFSQAQSRLHSPRQTALKEASADIDRAIGKDPAQRTDVIGAWRDGAENSLAIAMPGWSYAEAKAASAMKGYLADQKSVLLFAPDQAGSSFMMSFEAKGNLETIHADLLKSGLEFHTLEPVEGGARVHVYGEDQATIDKIEQAAKDHDATATLRHTIGHGEFIGTSKTEGTDREQRDDAKAEYEKIIAEVSQGVAGRDVEQAWNAIRARWSRGFPAEEKVKHPGINYSKEAYEDSKGVIHTSNVTDAAIALSENRKVNLNQPKQVSVLLHELGQVTKAMASMGEKAPTFNLCNVTVSGTSLFCVESQGIARVEMPQLNAQQTKDFVAHLKSEGYKTTPASEYAANLRATQNELNGVKVAGLTEAMETGTFKPGDVRLIVSRDDYILDGHHRWAAEIGVDAANNRLRDGKQIDITRIDISITDLLVEADKFTGGKGRKGVEDKRFQLRGGAHDVDYIQDPATGRFQGSRPGTGGGESTADGGKVGGGKSDTKVSDFSKDGVALDHSTQSDPKTQKKFLDEWNHTIKTSPGEFKKGYLAGNKGELRVEYNPYENTIEVGSNLQSSPGINIGEYTTTFKPDKRETYIDYFRLNPSAQAGKTGHSIGKEIIGQNIELSKQMGMTRVTLFANIDVGGYAWARYGWVPIQRDWNSLRTALMYRIDALSKGTTAFGGGGDSYTATSWEELTDSQQNSVERNFYRQTHNEFVDSEIENWRDSGQPLEDAKNNLVEQVNAGNQYEWPTHAIDAARNELDVTIPFSNKQIIDAMTLDFNSRYGDGRGDVTVTFDDTKLSAPAGYDPNQPTLPGIPKVEPHEYLTQDMRDEIENAIQTSFNTQAESMAADMDAPDYIAESAREFQEEMWSQKSEREKFQWAERHMADSDLQVEIPPDEDAPVIEPEGEMPKADADALMKLAESNDPKALWAIADSKWGKELLLNQNWHGALNFSDKQQMDRFNSYIAKGKKAA